MAAASAFAAVPLEHKRVLVLSPYAFGRPGVDSFVRTHVEALVAGGVRRDDVLVEYLNLNRDNSPAYRARLRQLLLDEYGERHIDFIVALQQPALDFLLDDLKALAPDAPTFAIDAAPPSAAALGRHRLLLPRQADNVRSTLDQAMHLFPATEHLIVAVGASPSDRQARQLIASQLAEMGWHANVEYLDALPFAGMLARTAAAPPRSVILAGPINRDAAGAITTSLDMTLQIARGANAPVFSLFSTGIGSGPVGGAVVHVEQRAQEAAGAVLAVLRGERRLAPGITPMDAPIVTMYDWPRLVRWGGDPARLPAGALFVNRPVPIWEAYRGTVLGGAAAISLLSLLAVALLVQHRKLRLAEGRFRVLVEHAPEAIVVYDVERGRFVDANSKAEQLFGASRAQLLAGGPERFYADAQPDGLPAALTLPRNAERGMAGEEVVFERVVRALDGREFPCEVRVVALPSRAGTLLRGGYVDISERKRAEQERALRQERLEEQVAERTAALSLAVQDAEAANRAKSVFLANMSHELRTPLNSIIGFSQIMAESTSMFDEEKHNLGLINRAGHHLLSLINDILELSKIEAGQLRLAPVSTALPALLRDSHDLVCLAARQKGLALTVQCPSALPAVLLDGGKLRQVLINLLSNAVKFTDSGAVTLSLEARPVGADQLALAFSVRDTGIGIASHDTEKIFEPFLQAETARTQAGTGLGLTIARQFVRLLGGELLVSSHPGHGATFSFSITAAIDADAAPAAAVSAPPASAPLVTSPITAGQLASLPAAQRQALHAALQQLDMRQVELLLAPIEAEHGALAAAMRTMLGQHRHPELCALLEQSPGAA